MSNIKLFQEKKIRSVWNEEEQHWYFSIVDVIEALTDSADRQNLTDEWKERGITDKSDYAILMAEISKATFGLAPSDYKIYKGLTKKN